MSVWLFQGGSPFIIRERKQQSGLNGECTLLDTTTTEDAEKMGKTVIHHAGWLRVRTRVVKWFKSHLSPSITADDLVCFAVFLVKMVLK